MGPIEFGSNSALALGAAHVYWDASSTFGRANLDGNAIAPEFVRTPGHDLAVSDAQILFSGFLASGTDIVYGIGRANVDGSGPDPLFISNLATPPLGLALGPGRIYWTTWDTDPPETRLTKRPPDRTERHTLKFKFASDEPGTTFKCKLDGKRFRPCSSPGKVKRLDEGNTASTCARSTPKATATPPPPKTSSRSSSDRFHHARLSRVGAGLSMLLSQITPLQNRVKGLVSST